MVTSISDIPDSLLLSVLGAVNRPTGNIMPARMCGTWAHLLPAFVHTMHVRDEAYPGPIDLAQELQGYPGIHVLKFGQCFAPVSMAGVVATIAANCPELQRLTFDERMAPWGYPQSNVDKERAAKAMTAELDALFTSCLKLTHVSFGKFQSRCQVLPDSLGLLTDLQSLAVTVRPWHTLNGGVVVSLPRAASCLRKLKSLSLNSSTDYLPHSLFTLSWLKDLFLDFNSITEVPTDIGSLACLRKLSLTCNKLVTLPGSLGQLEELRVLELIDCFNLVNLPEECKELSSLEVLKLCDVGLEAMPTSFGDLPRLRVFEIKSCDYLQELPLPFGNLRQLADLNIHQARSLLCLPEGFGTLSSLTKLSIADCPLLQRFPSDFVQLPCLQSLSIQGFSTLRGLPEGLENLSSLRQLTL